MQCWCLCLCIPAPGVLLLTHQIMENHGNVFADLLWYHHLSCYGIGRQNRQY
jgi:hypothetical protein